MMAIINSAAVNHPIRDFLIYSAVAGIPLNFIRFIIMVRPVAVFTLVLLISSAIFGFTVRRLHRQGAHLKSTFATPITDPMTCLVADVSLAILSLLTLIFTWTRNRWQDTGETFLVAYSSTPLMLNMFLHFYLALLVLLKTRGMQDIIRELVGDLGSSTAHECPRCHGRSEYHDDPEEEEHLVPHAQDEEERPGSGTQIAGPSSVWSE
ncbi:proteinrelated to nucleosome binding protein [Fusarium austroafricanum]|uniref:Proteinrelated to nucleosome binding protein n=1 Tax=Fusarium austroafricanum TaxID=2364996 RepID=A0A8H4JW83_9HYPO|nr:proteinrelated to nucleosome binding protein [Fusarium austroafricanum]